MSRPDPAATHELPAESLQRAIEFERAVAELAASLLRVPVDAIDARILEALEGLGKQLEADRASVLQNVRSPQILSRTHRWVRPGTFSPAVDEPRDAFPWLLARVLERRELVTFTRLDDLPSEAARDRAALQRNGVVSGALAPIVVDDRAIGVLLFATVTHEQPWSPNVVVRLRLVGEIIASALARRDAELALRAALAENEKLRERLAAENVYLQAELVDVQDLGEIVGGSAALRATLEKVRQVADTTAPVLLFGETGTGKELIARAIHAQSGRRVRSFIAVNCAALPATLIESELFGHEKGAFTGATQAKAGRFELADQGTLLLDEIGELELALQAKLLRVLEDGQIQRLGSTVSRKVEVRILAATNRDLRRDVREGRFRSDLYYRLSVFPQELAVIGHERLAEQAAPYVRTGLYWVAGRAGDFGALLVHLLLTVVIIAILYTTGERAASGIRRFARRLAGDRGCDRRPHQFRHHRAVRGAGDPGGDLPAARIVDRRYRAGPGGRNRAPGRLGSVGRVRMLRTTRRRARLEPSNVVAQRGRWWH